MLLFSVCLCDRKRGHDLKRMAPAHDAKMLTQQRHCAFVVCALRSNPRRCSRSNDRGHDLKRMAPAHDAKMLTQQRHCAMSLLREQQRHCARTRLPEPASPLQAAACAASAGGGSARGGGFATASGSKGRFSASGAPPGASDTAQIR
jgi:hypothetical protein